MLRRSLCWLWLLQGGDERGRLASRTHVADVQMIALCSGSILKTSNHMVLQPRVSPTGCLLTTLPSVPLPTAPPKRTQLYVRSTAPHLLGWVSFQVSTGPTVNTPPCFTQHCSCRPPSWALPLHCPVPGSSSPHLGSHLEISPGQFQCSEPS